MGLLGGAWSGGLTGDEDTNVLSEGLTSNEETSITNLTGDEETNVLQEGWIRETHDWLRDYEGEWGGEEDRHDITGPSISLTALGDPDRSVIAWRSDQSEENDPTRPGNLPWWVWALALLIVLALLANYAELAAKAT